MEICARHAQCKWEKERGGEKGYHVCVCVHPFTKKYKHMFFPIAMASTPQWPLAPEPSVGGFENLLFKFSKITKQREGAWKCVPVRS